ncbi:SGNH/GDSL hydrolase family protein [Chenggangzhangella methanolivorans]|uniref:SGNH hydrolase-type esterase domain-containing protein n=1 Tax=Chenggangzhangella methanolivorans TaxID=1437009 RepID=A0A9E6UNK2_9HYPH|nr:GDSL-type esterase/lipase family protein [Chenggangzhangella methanolivorans]QZO01201.1 hypothetical protein K6K41_06580 [Chenggangzhangella methanolivorans]
MTRLALGAIAAFMLAALFAGSGGEARAQGYSQRYYEAAPRERVYRERRVYDEDDDAYFERRQRYYSRDAVARRNAQRRMREVEVERPRSLNFFQRLFGGGSADTDQRSDQGAVEVRPAKRPPRRRPAVAARPPAPIPADPGAAAAAAAAGASVGAAAALQPGAAPAPAPVQPTTFVAVVGDSIADQLAVGLQEGFADAPELAVKRIVKPNSGLVRDDYFDVVAEARKVLDQGPLTYAVFEAGVNDRQPFLDMRKEPPLSDAWRKRYAERIDAVLAPFKERKIPIFWTGLTASESTRATADHVAINAIARERVEAAGGTYVDVWEGFVDEDGLYMESGPMLDGQIGRLRLDDGVHFSKAGARKLAHYVEQEIRKVFQPKSVQPDAVMAAIAPEAGATAIQPAPTAEQPRPISSPLMVLTAPRRSQGGALAAATPMPIPARDASQSAAKVLVNGEGMEADAGRMDDHRWPGAEQPAPAGPKTTEIKASPAAQTAQPATLIDPRPVEQQGR